MQFLGIWVVRLISNKPEILSAIKSIKLMWLNLCGCENVGRKLKNSLKLQIILSVFETVSQPHLIFFCVVDFEKRNSDYLQL